MSQHNKSKLVKISQNRSKRVKVVKMSQNESRWIYMFQYDETNPDKIDLFSARAFWNEQTD